MNDGNTWPEQEAVDAWLSEMGLDVDNRDSMKLKEAVTKPRLEMQHEVADLKRKLEECQEAKAEAQRIYGKVANQVSDLRAHADALAGALATANCPYPVIDDPTIQACVEAGECGCDSGNAYRNREE